MTRYEITEIFLGGSMTRRRTIEADNEDDAWEIYFEPCGNEVWISNDDLEFTDSDVSIEEFKEPPSFKDGHPLFKNWPKGET